MTNPPNIHYLELLRLALPECVLVLGVIAALALDLEVVRGRSIPVRWRVVVGAAISSCVLAFGLVIKGLPVGLSGSAMLVTGEMEAWVKAGILVLTILTLLLSMDGEFTSHIGEHVALTLLSAVGMMFLVSAGDLLMIFVALELTSLPLYVLTAFDKRSARSAEAGLKYFLFGGMAAAFTLYGMSLLYGLSGTTELHGIANAMRARGLDPLLAVAIVTTVIGFGFKVAVVPFHLWAPDTYQGAPTPSAAFIASGSKLASFFILAKIMFIGFAGVEGSAAWHHALPGWMPVIATVATLSMVLGNFAAIAQRDVKRLLAYSAIAHGGYALLGILAMNNRGMGAVIYYAFTYGITVVGAFGVVSAVERATGGSQLENFAGLAGRSPALAATMAVFVLSLAGIPPLAGFFGKFYLFAAAAGGGGSPMGLLWLVILAVAMSAVSLYYYLQILKQIYVVRTPDNVDAPQIPIGTRLALVISATLVVVLGCLPDVIIGPLDGAIHRALIWNL